MLAVIYKWLKNAVFCSESWTAIKQTFPKMDEVRNNAFSFALCFVLVYEYYVRETISCQDRLGSSPNKTEQERRLRLRLCLRRRR